MGKSVVLILRSIESGFSGPRHRVRGVEGGRRDAIAVGPSADASRHGRALSPDRYRNRAGTVVVDTL